MADTLDYFAEYLYPRFEWRVISSYEKAVEYINKKILLERESDQPMKPSLILNPSGDFDFDEAGGKQPWRFPNLAPGMVKYLFSPIYQDQNVIITPGFSRIKGEMEFMALLSSFYEYCDFKMLLGLIFAGKDRYIYPQWFNSFIILPQEIYDYEYVNPYTGVSYTIDIWGSENRLIKTTNKTEVVFPFRILPRYKLTGMSDGSERFGGTDKLPEWKLNFTLEYEVEIPSFLVLETDYILKDFKVNIGYDSCYSSNEAYNSDEIPVNIQTFTGEMIYYDSTSGLEIDLDSPYAVPIDQGPDHMNITNKKELVFNTRYFHIVTQEEADSTTTVDFTLPEQILPKDSDLLRVQGRYGALTYKDHYSISDDGLDIIIDKSHVTLKKDDVLELYFYKWV
jgi:hypothetical protein